MGHAIHTLSSPVRAVEFSRRKYGSDLLVDTAWISDMPSFIATVEPYSLDFYDITLVTQGRGSFWLDDHEYSVEEGSLYFTTPGQIRRWYVNDLDGICLFFPADFLLRHFNDPLLLHRLNYFHTNDGPFSLPLDNDTQARLLERFRAMHNEIRALREDSEDLLRAIAYEILITINRLYSAFYGQVVESPENPTVSKFRQCLQQEFHRRHHVNDYARLLSVTPGHLNVLCKQHLGCNASSMITQRVMSEAARRLAHTHDSVESIAESLGFTSASYFSRAFKREKGMSPLSYRMSR